MLRIDRRRWLTAAGLGALLPQVARAQKAGRVARVGWLGWTGLSGVTASAVPLESFRSGLSARGWQEGRDLALEVRSGDGPRASELAGELVRAEVDLLVAQGPMVFGARAVAGQLPIVFAINGDPVEARLVSSLPRPGGNLTGVTALSVELAGKRVQLVRELMGRPGRVAVIANQAHPGVQTEYAACHEAARALGVSLQWLPLYSAAELAPALEAAQRGGAAALLAVPDNLINQQAGIIAAFAARHRLPTVSGWSEFTEAGNLLSYGPSLRGYFRHVAVYADKVLRGAKPQDLPVEQPTEFELVVNLKTARALGLTVPNSVLVRADRVIG